MEGIVRKRKYKLPSSIKVYYRICTVTKTYQNRNNSWTPECVLSFNMCWRMLVNFIHQPMHHVWYGRYMGRKVILRIICCPYFSVNDFFKISKSISFYKDIILGLACPYLCTRSYLPSRSTLVLPW
jgi:hypothetical protein